jgi:hypothetical protein
MFNIFRKSKCKDLWSQQYLQNISFSELNANWAHITPDIINRSYLDITRRLVDIIFDQPDLTVDEVARAKSLLTYIIDGIESGFSNNPVALQNYRAAYNSHIQHRKSFGRGSLYEKVKDLPSDSQKIDVIISKDNAHLLLDFPDDLKNKFRISFIKALIRDRVPAKQADSALSEDADAFLFQKIKYANAVNTAGWLIITKDQTALFLFNEIEKHALGEYLFNYDNARKVLVDGQIISNTRCLSFTPIPDPASVHAYMFSTSAAKRDTAEVDSLRGDERERLLNLDRQGREAFLSIITAYRLFVWQSTVRAIYGQKYLNEVNSLLAPAENQFAKYADSTLNKLYEFLRTNSNEVSFDHLILAEMMYEHFDRTLPERILTEQLTSCSRVLRNEMFYFPLYVRYLMRTIVHGTDKKIEAIVEDPLI